VFAHKNIGHEPEYDLDHLEGYRKSRSVRIGNGVYTQKQLNIYGEALDAIHIMSGFRGIYYEGWMKLVKMLDWLGKKRLQAYCLAT
jgi:GH15 family glucan-1,4-alpha-glucosidase